MTINWTTVATIAALIIALFVGAWLNRWLEGRPVLISFYGHVAAFNPTPPGGQPFHINTHAVVLRNASRKPATNVRLHHHGIVPLFSIWPDVPHKVETLPGGSQDIVVPSLVPGKEISVSYLYFPPVTFDQVHAGIECDQGFARAIPVLLQRQYPRWFIRILRVVLIVGLVAIAYPLYRGLVWVLR